MARVNAVDRINMLAFEKLTTPIVTVYARHFPGQTDMHGRRLYLHNIIYFRFYFILNRHDYEEQIRKIDGFHVELVNNPSKDDELLTKLVLRVGARVMLTQNIGTALKLVNCATGM